MPGPFSRATLLVALLAPVPANAAIFADGFESGSRCGWDGAVGAADTILESFDVADGSPWPAPWMPVGGSVAFSDVQGGRARFRPVPSGYSLARLAGPAAPSEVEVAFTFVFEDPGTQGIGFYVRSSGGYLDVTDPVGSGYAVFVEDFRGSAGIGLWREENGVEIPIEIFFDDALGFAADLPYRVRFRLHQLSDGTTSMRARVWPAAGVEPEGWQVEATSTQLGLQGQGGVIALDAWSSIQSPSPIPAHVLVDDLSVGPACNPARLVGAPETLPGSYQFAEGPLWRDDHLLLSDIDASTIYRIDPPGAPTVFRSPSGESNGLALTVNGELLAAEHANRRVSVTDSEGVVTTLVGDYLGDAFNSPNDIAVRSDGTIYFTDPTYGLSGVREIPFNGLFRLPPGGPLAVEWMGDPSTNQPNGVALSPDESVLYASDTASGTVLVWDVAGDGSLSGMRGFASGLTVPDGMCVDRRGNLYVATWQPSVEVFHPDGTPWGEIGVPGAATNCTFGGAARRDLYVTTSTALLRRAAGISGLDPGP